MHTLRLIVSSSLALAIGLAGIANAQTVPPPESGLQPASEQNVPVASQLPQLKDAGADRRPISVAEAIALGLQNNLDVEVQRFSPYIAQANADEAWGAYDPLFSGDIGYDTNQNPTSNILATGGDPRKSTSFSTNGEGGLNALLPYIGATVGIQTSGAVTNTDVGIETFSPKYESSLFFTASIPLLRGLIWNEAWTNVKTSNLQYEASREDFRTSVMDVVQNIDTAYWNLVAAEQQLAVAQKSLETAQALLDQTQTQYDVGVVSKVEVVQAEAGVANREFQLITNENAYRTAQDQLINQVFGRQLRASTSLEFRPTDDPQSYIKYDVDVEQAASTAFRKRPELQTARLTIETNEVQVRFAKNQRLPQFNVEGSYGFLGLSGQVADQCGQTFPCSPSPSRIGDYGTSYDDYFREPGARNASVRGVFSIPLLNTSARKKLDGARFQLRRSESTLARLRQQIILDVRERVRNLDSAQRGIVSAERNRAATEEQLRAERIRLEYGESTPFDVLQRESDLVTAESQMIGALQVYWTSLTQLARAQGTILEQHGIQIDEVESLR